MAISLFKAYFVGHFCYNSNGKIRINAKRLHFIYSYINQPKEIGEKQYSVFSSRGGQIAP